MHHLPNLLVVTFRYEEVEMEEHMRLRNFTEISLGKVCQTKYLDKKANPFEEENQDVNQFGYTLKAMVAFDNKQNPDSCFNTYVRSDGQKWRKFSRTQASTVDQTELNSVVHPYILIYEKIWMAEQERIDVISQAEADLAAHSKGEM